jgi:hypothetical protein
MKKVSEVNIKPVKQSGSLVGFLSCLYDSFYLTDIAIHMKKSGGYRLVFPLNRFGLNTFHPINKEFEEEVLKDINNFFEGRI